MKLTIDSSPAIRRAAADSSNDPSELAALLCDENLFVRRGALANPQAPSNVIDLLVRAGASADLRGKGEADPAVSPEELEHLATLGPFGRELSAAHPNSPGRLLETIAADASRAVRLAILKHPECPAGLLEAACVSMDADERRVAANHQKAPADLIKILQLAGADSQLQAVRPPQEPLAVELIERLASLGNCGRVIAAVQRNCPRPLLETIAVDDDWRVRLAVLDNPTTPTAALEHLSSIDDDQIRLRLLEHPNVPPRVVTEAANHPHLEVRIAAARHPSAPAEALRTLATDGTHQVREIVASHPRRPRNTIDQLRRLGSAEDLLNFGAADPELAPAEIASLAELGLWARRLAARHPNTDSTTLQTLACDADHVVREWAARHPNMSSGFLTLLERLGATRDLLGRAHPDPTLEPAELESSSRLGPWAARLVAQHPKTPGALLAVFAESEDAGLRAAVASHANTPSSSLSALVRDEVPEVRFAVASHPGLESTDAAHLSTDAIAGIRFALVQNAAVGEDIIAGLELDLNPDIAAAAKARRGPRSPSGDYER